MSSLPWLLSTLSWFYKVVKCIWEGLGRQDLTLGISEAGLKLMTASAGIGLELRFWAE